MKLEILEDLLAMEFKRATTQGSWLSCLTYFLLGELFALHTANTERNTSSFLLLLPSDFVFGYAVHTLGHLACWVACIFAVIGNSISLDI